MPQVFAQKLQGIVLFKTGNLFKILVRQLWYLDVHDELGSGYPSDPKTKAWLAKYRHKVFGYPNLIRFSWQTCTNAL